MFNRLEKDDSDYIFFDRTSGQRWERYSFELDNEPVYGFRRFPSPPFTDIIKIILSSMHLDEVSGACGFLLELEYNERFEFREKLIDSLEANIKTIETDRFEIIFDRTVLNSRLNKRDVLGKSIKEVMSDAEYFNTLASRAESLRKIYFC